MMLQPQHFVDAIQSPTDNETEALACGGGNDDGPLFQDNNTGLCDSNPDNDHDNPHSHCYEDGSANTQNYMSAAIAVVVAFLSMIGCCVVMQEFWIDCRHSSSGRLRRQSSTHG